MQFIFMKDRIVQIRGDGQINVLWEEEQPAERSSAMFGFDA